MMRRRTLLSSLAGGLVGAGMVAGLSGDTRAAVTLEQLSVHDHEASVRDDVTDVRVSCEGGYEWDIPADAAEPEMWQLALYAGEDDSAIATADGRVYNRESSGTATLEGSLLDADGVTAADFEPDGSPVTVTVPVTLVLTVIGGSDTLASASQQGTGEIAVSQAGYDASLHGSVGGDVTFSVEE